MVATMPASASAHLDLIRAVAAGAVMWGHVRALFFVDFGHIQHHGALSRLIYLLTGFGHQAVVVFFVLSGFLISSTILRAQASGTWSWSEYALARAVRLYIVLIPGLLLGFLWDMAGSSLFASSGLYSHPLDGIDSAIVANRLTLRIFGGNLLFLQNIECQTFGSNGPLWSLANEFWYYVLFPICLTAGLAWYANVRFKAITFTLAALALAVFLGPALLTGFIIWMAGCVLMIAHSTLRFSSKRWQPFYLSGCAVALCGCLLATRTGSLSGSVGDIAVAIAFTFFLFGVLHVDVSRNIRSYLRLARRIAGFSYSLYVLHFPLLLFFRGLVSPSQRWQPDVPHLLAGWTIGALAIGFAWLISSVTEARTQQVRTWLRAALVGLRNRRTDRIVEAVGI